MLIRLRSGNGAFRLYNDRQNLRQMDTRRTARGRDESFRDVQPEREDCMSEDVCEVNAGIP